MPTKMPTEGLVFKPEDFKVKPIAEQKRKARAGELPGSAASSTSGISKGKGKLKPGVEDPLKEFYAEAKAQAEHDGRAGVRP